MQHYLFITTLNLKQKYELISGKKKYFIIAAVIKNKKINTKMMMVIGNKKQLHKFIKKKLVYLTIYQTFLSATEAEHKKTT